MFTEKPAPEDFNSGNFLPGMVSKLKEDSGATVNPETLRAMSDAYDETIRYIDDGLGRLFELLKSRGLYDNTLVIITADHGEEFMEHGLLGHGLSLYDEVIRVPLIVKFPCPGPHCSPRVVTSQVELVDVFPTVLQVLGIEPPASLVGRSLAEEASAPRAAFSEFKSNSEFKSQIALRTPEWKWIYDDQADAGELYNLSQDPRETVDLAADEPAVRELLSVRVLDFAATHASIGAGNAVVADEKMLENLEALGYVK
jgi:arylsulfatase A-like enzyme